MNYVDNSELTVTKRQINKKTKLQNELSHLTIKTDRVQFINGNQRHWAKFKKELKKLSLKKCWYCEKEILCFYGHVDHYRPKNSVKNIDGSIEDGYWWLAFEPSNFRLTCDVCNSKKGDYFPLLSGSTRGTFQTGVLLEKPVLLDPTNYEDTRLVFFMDDGTAIPHPDLCRGSNHLRASETIKTILNHEDHVESRIRIIQSCEKLRKKFSKMHAIWKRDPLNWEDSYEDLLDDFFKLISTDAPFSACAYAYFKGHREEEWAQQFFG